MFNYKVYFDGGKYNGAERYYKSLSVARRVASRYVRETYFTQLENAFCEIYRVLVGPFRCSSVLLESVDVYSLKSV